MHHHLMTWMLGAIRAVLRSVNTLKHKSRRHGLSCTMYWTCLCVCQTASGTDLCVERMLRSVFSESIMIRSCCDAAWVLNAHNHRWHAGLSEVLRQHTFVGMADETLALLQHSTRLYILNVANLSKDMFYQQVGLLIHRQQGLAVSDCACWCRCENLHTHLSLWFEYSARSRVLLVGKQPTPLLPA